MNTPTKNFSGQSARQIKDAEWQRILAIFRHPDALFKRVDEQAERNKQPAAPKP